MKKQFFFCLFALAITSTSIKAQQITAATSQATEKKEPNALTKIALLRLSAEGIANNVLGKAYPIFFEYYTSKKNITEQAASTSNNTVEEYAKIIAKRDEKLSIIFSEKEMKNYKNKVEAELAAAENR
jgi:hypothetical protein